MEKHLYPTNEDPMYGESFVINGAQFRDINGNYTEMIECSLTNGDYEKNIYQVGNMWEDWKKMKKNLSDILTSIFNRAGIKTKFREVTVFKVSYIGIPGTYLI